MVSIHLHLHMLSQTCSSGQQRVSRMPVMHIGAWLPPEA